MDLGVAPTRSDSDRRVAEMRGPVRFFAWSSDAGRQVETVRVVLTERGLRASGTIVTLDERPTSTSYALLCDAAGRTRRLNVRSESPATERALALTRTPGGPWLDGVGRPPPGPDLDDAADAHLSASVFTLGLAIRRLGLHRTALPSQTTAITVAHVLLPDLAVETTLHQLRAIGPAAGGLRIDLLVETGHVPMTVDTEGFVVDIGARTDRPG